MSLRSLFESAAARGLLVAVYAVALAAFYWKYVPLVPAFQAVLFPILAGMGILSALDARRGILAFLFIFPLINNLPYLFGIVDPIPSAPTALILFLFFFGGRLWASVRAGFGSPSGEPILRPLSLAAVLVAVSAAVTLWRYAGFFPIASGRILEWAVNAHGVTSGGAFMSVLITALNYLTAFAFFVLFLRTDRTRAFFHKSLTAIGAGAILSCAFGFVQLAGNLELGNNPLSIASELINGTFKDSISFGCFLSMALPLALGVAVTRRGPARAAAAALAAAALVLILAAGSKSAFFGALTGLAVFLALAAVRRRGEAGAGRASRRLAALVLAGAIIAVGAGVVAVRSGLLPKVLSMRTIERLPGTKHQLSLRINTLWRLAGDCVTASPLTGVGIGAYIIESSNFTAGRGGSLKDLPDSAENYFLQVAAELGLAGLAVFLWFFWEIFRKGLSAWRGSRPRSPDRWLLAGAISGLAAYAVNIMTHSFVGSFEIKYAFWFLVAAVFILGRPDEPSEAGQPSAAERTVRRGRAAAVTAAVVLFGAAHLWVSARALSLGRSTLRYPIPREAGVGGIEKTHDGREFRWTREYGGVPVNIETRSLVLSLHASHPDIRANPVSVRISLSPDIFHRGRTLKELALASPDWREIVLDIPAGDVGRQIILFFDVGRTWNPSKTTGAPDSRNLGIAVGPVRFR